MEIKKFVTVSLIIFIVFVIVVLGFATLSNQAESQNTVTAQNPEQNSGVVQNNEFTLADVSKHNDPNDCWVIVNNKIYNVTSVILNHPGGQEAIISECGKDATATFETKDGRGQHSQNAQNILNQLYVGNIKR
jgi:cytochrome b involved in lipid metabolism